MELSNGQIMHPCQVFSNDVELDVDNCAWLDGMKVRVVEGVGNDADLEGVFRWPANCEAHAIDRHAALIDGEVAVLHHLLRTLVFEGVLMAALLVFHSDASGGLVHMALHDMSIQSPVHHHRALHIHLVAHLEQTKIAALQSLPHGGNGIGVVLETHNREADAVVGDALVNVQLVYKGACKRQVHIVLLVFDGHYSCHSFYNSGKHSFQIIKVI